MEARVVEIILPNEATALILAKDIEEVAATKTALRDPFDFAQVISTIEGVSEAMKAAVTKAKPDRVTVCFGVDIAIKAGRLVGLLVDGESKGSLSVTLEWAGVTDA